MGQAYKARHASMRGPHSSATGSTGLYPRGIHERSLRLLLFQNDGFYRTLSKSSALEESEGVSLSGSNHDLNIRKQG
jgi:hypothetical protein